MHNTARFKAQESATDFLSSVESLLSDIERKLVQVNQNHQICSPEGRRELEAIIFQHSPLQEITYIENGQIVCSDRELASSRPKMSDVHIAQIGMEKDYAIYRSTSQRRGIDGIFFMVPAGHGWYRALIDSNYLDFWLNELTKERKLFACVRNNLNATLCQTSNSTAGHKLFSVTQQSKIYPISVTTGFTHTLLIETMLTKLPYAIFLIISFAILTVTGLHNFLHWRRSQLSEIQRGIEKKEFYAYYQPIVDSATGQWKGAELLVRWYHPKSQVIAPDQFLPTAERSGLINEITLQLIERAALEKEELSKYCGHNFYISINVTASMIANPAFVGAIANLIQRYPVLKQGVVMEFTERENFSNTDIDLLQSGMRTLRGLGIRWALDDFGTGYAGLSTLRALSFDILKIDRTFVASSLTDSVTQSILGNIAEMGHKLRCNLVAEGVETQEQAEQVRSLGIQSCQGYYFAKPMPFETFKAGWEDSACKIKDSAKGQEETIGVL
ncbi:EAL domain-containing protein [Photobacterium sanctipauli]|nr:EAL domain-containing protein [Photobacterium sanctipauli]